MSTDKSITSEAVIAYSLCPRKAFLLMCTPERGTRHEYEQILEQQRQANQRKHLANLQPNSADRLSYSIDNPDDAPDVLPDVALRVGSLQADCELLTKVNKQLYEPTI